MRAQAQRCSQVAQQGAQAGGARRGDAGEQRSAQAAVPNRRSADWHGKRAAAKDLPVLHEEARQTAAATVGSRGG